MVSKTAQRWQRARAETRNGIIESATRVLQEFGYAAASMTRVAQAAGVTKATVYAHFRDKERLFASVMEHHASKFTLPALAVREHATLGETLDCVATEIRTLASNASFLCFSRILQRSAGHADTYAQYLDRHFDPHRRCVASALEREAAETAPAYADLFVCLILRAHPLHSGGTHTTTAAATLGLFEKAFAPRAKPA